MFDKLWLYIIFILNILIRLSDHRIISEISKSKLPTLKNSGIYKLQCNEYIAIYYVEQTSRSFHTRFKEHTRSKLITNSRELSSITTYKCIRKCMNVDKLGNEFSILFLSNFRKCFVAGWNIAWTRNPLISILTK